MPVLVRRLISASPNIWATGSSAAFLAGETTTPPRDYDLFVTDIHTWNWVLQFLEESKYVTERNILAGFKVKLPEGVELDIWYDTLERRMLSPYTKALFCFVHNRYWTSNA
jgi:hypothetical protein